MALTVKPLDQVRKSVPVSAVANIQNELVRVNIEVEKETRQKWHSEAINREMSLKDLILQAMNSYLK